MRLKVIAFVLLLAVSAAAQSVHKKQYSESLSQCDRSEFVEAKETTDDSDVIWVETDLITIPVRVTTKDGRPVPDIKQSEFRIFEDGEEQEVAFFGTNDAPFTVALLLDMTYSSVFKLEEIQSAATIAKSPSLSPTHVAEKSVFPTNMLSISRANISATASSRSHLQRRSKKANMVSICSIAAMRTRLRASVRSSSISV